MQTIIWCEAISILPIWPKCTMCKVRHQILAEKTGNKDGLTLFSVENKCPYCGHYEGKGVCKTSVWTKAAELMSLGSLKPPADFNSPLQQTLRARSLFQLFGQVEWPVEDNLIAFFDTDDFNSGKK